MLDMLRREYPMKYNKLLTLSLISTMTAATLMFTGCGEDKKTTAENTKVEKTDEKTQKEDTSNEDTNTASEEVEEVRYNEEGYRIFDTFNGNLNEVDVGEIVWDEGEGCYMQYEGDGCWMYNPFDEDTVVQSEPRPITDWDEIAASSRGRIEDKMAYDEYVESLNLPEHW